MVEFLNILSEKYVLVVAFWIIFSSLILLVSRHVFVTFLDPYVFYVVTAIAPGLAGFLVVSFFSLQTSSHISKFILIISLYLIYFCAYAWQFKGSLNFTTSLLGSRFLHSSFILIITAIILANILQNGNFETKDPSMRFSAVRYPILNFIAISVQPLLLFMVLFTPYKQAKILSLIMLVLTFVMQSQIGISKSRYVDIFILLSISASRMNILDKRRLGSFLKNLRLRYITLKYFFYILFLPIIIVSLLFYNTGISLRSLLFRFVLSLDSTLIYGSHSNFGNDERHAETGFASVIEIWLKPFIKQITGKSYEFDNISEYLTFTVTGYAASDYSQSSWQPNNNLVVDFAVMHGYFAPISMLLAAVLIGKFASRLKNTKNLSFLMYPSYCFIVLAPFRLLTDAQSFFVSLILATSICACCYFISSLLPVRSAFER